jgi:kumamolisin
MTPRRFMFLTFVATLCASVAAGVVYLRPAARSAEAVSAATESLGPTKSDSAIEFGIVLRLRDREVDRYLSDVQDPGSSRYHQYLSAAAFGRSFGLADSALTHVRARLARAGLRVVASYPQRTNFLIRGTVARTSAFLGVRFNDYRDPGGHRFHAPVGTPVIPDDLATAVSAYSNLDNRPRIMPADIPSGQCGVPPRDLYACSGLTPRQLAKAYDITPLHDAGIDGTGQTVAIVSFATFRDTDIAFWDRRFGITGPPVSHIVVGDADPDGLGTDFEREVDLDVQMIRAVAPKAQILNYEAINDSTATFHGMFDRIVADGKADIVSVSWGNCDGRPNSPPGDWQADQQSMKAAAARGVTIYIASGDAGAYSCQRGDLTSHVPTGDWPSDSPFAVSVGGTLLSVRRDGSYLEEAGWEGILSNLGSGGGLNPVDPRPSWQDAPGVKNGFSTGKRQFPDVSGPADPASGIFTVTDGEIETGSGTSQATPFLAGLMALVRQLAQKEGAGKVGFAAPIFYALAREKQDLPPFHDIVRGGNRHYNATPGWDYATGLGTPDANNLAHAVVAYLKKHPAHALK